MNRVFIGLGSNLHDPITQLKQAIDHIDELESVKLVATSAFYQSKPMGPQEQPDFINAVVELETSLSAEKLLDALQAIEHAQGRVRKQHWGPRTLDLDILLYNDEMITSERLMVPHSGIAERNFVLSPLADIVGLDFKIPGMGSIKELLISCPIGGLQQLEL